MLTVREVAEFLGLSTVKVILLAEAGKIPAIHRKNRPPVFSRPAIAQWLDSMRIMIGA